MDYNFYFDGVTVKNSIIILHYTQLCVDGVVKFSLLLPSSGNGWANLHMKKPLEIKCKGRKIADINDIGRENEEQELALVNQ